MINNYIRMTASAGDYTELNQESLAISSISVFLTGFVSEQIQSDNNNLFKSIKLNVNEFTRSGSTGKKF